MYIIYSNKQNYLLSSLPNQTDQRLLCFEHKLFYIEDAMFCSNLKCYKICEFQWNIRIQTKKKICHI